MEKIEQNKMKICLVISSLQCGGAERVMSLLAKAWVDKGFEVTLITLNSPETDFYVLDERVKRRSLYVAFESKNIFHGLINNIKRVRSLRRALVSEAPNCIISFLEATNITTLIASRGLNTPVLVSIRTDPRHYSIGAIRTRVRKILYPMAAVVVVQTETVAQWMAKEIPTAHALVIPNPVKNIDSVTDVWSKKAAGKKNVVGMGRLVEKKGFDLLIPAFARCIQSGLDWQLVIIGQGPLEAELKMLAQELGVIDSVLFTGQLSDPDSILQASDIFVLSSRTEGFPNALLEAMCCGLPVIAFDCESGPSDMIENEVNGLLVPNEDETGLYNALLSLMHDEQHRSKLAEEAAKIRQKYSLTQIEAQWSELINEAQ